MCTKRLVQNVVTALFMISLNSKESKYPSASEWMHKSWYADTMNYCSIIKRNELLKYRLIQMNLIDINYNEIK